MKEIVVISGKGGTGKTSVTAAFAALGQPLVLADCDVDAADLHLVVGPEVETTEPFIAGTEATILATACQRCGRCAEVCRFGAVARDSDGAYAIDPLACEGCGVCAAVCPHAAVTLSAATAGAWYRSRTRFGPMVHARLGTAAENSGKLVALVRREARVLAAAAGASLLLVDGPPGIGCPVISSISGADLVVIVTEPTVSGAHDLGRVAELASHFRVPACVIVNKADLHPPTAARIVSSALAQGLTVLGTLPYDAAATAAQLAGLSVVEHGHSPLRRSLEIVWGRLQARLAAMPAGASVA